MTADPSTSTIDTNTHGTEAQGASATTYPDSRRPTAQPAAVPFGRLLAVELRKMVDTRSGRWLLAVIVGLAAAVLVGLHIWADGPMQTFSALFSFASIPVGFLLPVLAILTMTSEWSQRTALVTFTLEPRRLRVILAKSLAGLLVGVAVLAIVAVLAAIGTVAATVRFDVVDPWQLRAGPFAMSLLALAIPLVQGLAFGLLFANSALAIVLYYVIPMAFSFLHLWSAAATVLKWTDVNMAMQPLETGAMSTEQWQHLGVSALVWVVLPYVVGAVLTIRREVK